MTDNGKQIGTPQTVSGIPAGGTATVTVIWSTKGLRGQHTVAVTADPADAVAESQEGNNSASRVVTFKK